MTYWNAPPGEAAPPGPATPPPAWRGWLRRLCAQAGTFLWSGLVVASAIAARVYHALWPLISPIVMATLTMLFAITPMLVIVALVYINRSLPDPSADESSKTNLTRNHQMEPVQGGWLDHFFRTLLFDGTGHIDSTKVGLLVVTAIAMAFGMRMWLRNRHPPEPPVPPVPLGPMPYMPPPGYRYPPPPPPPPFPPPRNRTQ